MNNLGNAQYTVVINLADVLQAHSQGMLLAYQMGRDSISQEILLLQKQLSAVEERWYIGIFDAVSYGIYNSEEALHRSEPYWDAVTVQKRRFKTEMEALHYAQNGVAGLRQIDINSVPGMKFPLNWRQML